MGLKIFFGPKQLWVKKMWVKKNWSKKLLVPKKWSKKLLVQRSFGSKKNLGLKKFFLQTNFWSKKIVGPQFFWIKQMFANIKSFAFLVFSREDLGNKFLFARGTAYLISQLPSPQSQCLLSNLLLNI